MLSLHRFLFLAKIIFIILNRFEIIRVCYRIYFCKEGRFRKVRQKFPRKFSGEGQISWDTMKSWLFGRSRIPGPLPVYLLCSNFILRHIYGFYSRLRQLYSTSQEVLKILTFLQCVAFLSTSIFLSSWAIVDI